MFERLIETEVIRFVHASPNLAAKQHADCGSANDCRNPAAAIAELRADRSTGRPGERLTNEFAVAPSQVQVQRPFR